MILKKIPNKWIQYLKRTNNHNLATLEEIQNILKPIEEADEREQQDSSRLKLKPRFDRRNNDKKGRSENPYKKDGHTHD